MTFKADSDVKAPLDLTATIGIDGGVFRDLLSFTVCRVAETPPDIGQLHNYNCYAYPLRVLHLFIHCTQ